MKKFIKPLLYSFIILFILTFIITLLNYIGLISGLPLKIIKTTIPIISYIIAGFMIGKNSNKKGWLSGIDIGLIITTILIILNLLFNNNITLYTMLYYISLIIISILSSIMGINRKKWLLSHFLYTQFKWYCNSIPIYYLYIKY